MQLRALSIAAAALAVFLAGCSPPSEPARTQAPAAAPATTATTVSRAPWGELPNGTAVELFTLTNAKGMQVGVTTYGGILTSIKVPDRKGQLGDVTLKLGAADEQRLDGAAR